MYKLLTKENIYKFNIKINTKEVLHIFSVKSINSYAVCYWRETKDISMDIIVWGYDCTKY